MDTTTSFDYSPSSKRPRDNTSDTLIEQDLKAPRLSSNDKKFFVALIRESENLTSQTIKDSIRSSEEKHFSFIEGLITESEHRIRSLVETEFQNIKTTISKITDRIDRLEIKSSEIDCMKDEIHELKRKILTHENSVVAGGIRIVGVPQMENENLHHVFNAICNSLNVPPPKIETIYRLKKIYKNNKPYTPNDEVIVAKLQSPYDKNFLLKSISKFRRDNKTSLCLNHVGMQSDQPIYINENLTPHNHRIFKEALRMKKEKKLNAAYTLRGLVYIKTFTSDDPVLVEFFEDFDKLFR